MEGLHIPFLKLFDRGEANHTLFEMIRANTRLPVDTIGDVYSLANCNEMGCRYLREMMDEFGLASLDSLADYICSRSEAAVRARIAELPNGSWSYEMMADGYEQPITLSATTTISDDGITVDYAGTSPGPEARRQRSAGLHDGLYGVRLSVRAGTGHTQQCRLAGAVQGHGAGRFAAQSAKARRRAGASCHRTNAA